MISYWFLSFTICLNNQNPVTLPSPREQAGRPTITCYMTKTDSQRTAFSSWPIRCATRMLGARAVFPYHLPPITHIWWHSEPDFTWLATVLEGRENDTTPYVHTRLSQVREQKELFQVSELGCEWGKIKIFFLREATKKNFWTLALEECCHLSELFHLCWFSGMPYRLRVQW